jgi:MFS family permease
MNFNGRTGDLGIVFLFWCGASIAGGVIYGALKRSVNPLWLLGLMAILIIPMGFATNAWTLGLLSILPGLLCAPVLTSSAEHIADLVSEKRRGEAMGWYGSSMTIGGAMGAPFTGAMIDSIGPWAGFVIVGLICAVLAILGLLTMARLRRRSSRSTRQDNKDQQPGADVHGADVHNADVHKAPGGGAMTSEATP